MLAALGSGSGKTVITCGLLAALKRRGLPVQSFKCGPDYIDPMFHTRVLGIPSRNLDLFLQGKSGVRQSLTRQTEEVALIEGVMGFYDGIGGAVDGSAWDIACTADLPVVLVLRPKGASVTLAAQIRGLQTFRTPSRIAGLLLNDCKSALCAHLTPLLERETGLPVLGCLPPMEEARLDSRHLGLLTAGEIADCAARFDAIARQMEKTVDLPALLALAGEAPENRASPPRPPSRCRIAVARDAAFCFCYQDNLDRLEENGARIVFFSPLHDRSLPPQVDGLYLVGGYPELYAQALSENRRMRASILRAVGEGLPTVAECGGFLYLQQTLEDGDGVPWPMAGVLPGAGFKTSRLQRFGYLTLTAAEDSLLFERGETVPAHEFHYWDCTQNGGAFTGQKPGGGPAWRCGVTSPDLYAAFPHLYFSGEMARRFTDRAAAWKGVHRCKQN